MHLNRGTRIKIMPEFPARFRLSGLIKGLALWDSGVLSFEFWEFSHRRTIAAKRETTVHQVTRH